MAAQLALNKQMRGYKGALARAAKCHPSYLSRVLANEVELTSEHAVGLARHWQLDTDGSEYFVLLVEHARAGSAELRRLYEGMIQRIQNAKARIENRIKPQKIASEADQFRYYSSWIYSALHMLAGLPQSDTTVALSDQLGLPRSVTESALNELMSMGLVKSQAGRWLGTDVSMHVNRDSPTSVIHQSNWRQRAIASINQGNRLHYTALHTLSRRDFEALNEMALSFIEESRRLVGPSAEEEAICINLDVFPLR